MTLPEKFTAANDYLVNAILEKILGHLPSRPEMRTYFSIEFNEQTHENIMKWKGKKIMSSVLRQNVETGVIEGNFDIPQNMVDEYIIDKVQNWSK